MSEAPPTPMPPISACPPNLERHWKRQLVSRERVAAVLAEADLALTGEWAAHDEAVRLTLANILTRTLKRQFIAHQTKIPARKYRSVAALSRKLQDVLLSLQDTDDPPELLPEDERGRTHWEIWANLSKGLQPVGLEPATDADALAELATFHQLALGKRTAGYSRGNSPLSTFLRITFRHAWEEYQDRLTEPVLGTAHSLRAPDEEALVKARSRRALRVVAHRTVRGDFERFCAAKTVNAVKGNNWNRNSLSSGNRRQR